MGLQDVLAQFEAAIATDPRVPSGLLFHFGPASLSKEDAPPRVVWVPVAGPVEGPEKSTPINPTQILTRRCTVEAHCWGETYSLAEALAEVVWTGIHNVAVGSFTPSNEDPGIPDNLQRGWLIILNFQLLLPVSKWADPDVTPDTIALSGELDSQ